MIVVCPACQARFQYDDSRFGEARAKRFKCPKCAGLFEVANPTVTGFPAADTPSRLFTAPVPEPEPPQAPATPLPSPAMALTTARRDRDAMLASAGFLDSGLPQGFRFSLAVLTGPHASTVKVLETPQVIIGREEGDVVTQDPETSRRHAMLEIRSDGTVWITDQQSTNGTLVNGERISGSVQLRSQQEFTCGNSTFMLLIRNTDEYPLN